MYTLSINNSYVLTHIVNLKLKKERIRKREKNLREKLVKGARISDF